MPGKVWIRIQAQAGYCFDLLFAAARLYLPQEEQTAQTRRLSSSLRYLREELPAPDERLAALFLPKGNQLFLAEQYAGHFFRYDPAERLLRTISAADKTLLTEQLTAFWTMDCGEQPPAAVALSLAALEETPTLMTTESVRLLRRIENRLRVIYQTQREALSAFQLEAERAPFPWNEAGLSGCVENAALLVQDEDQHWLAALSLFAENALCCFGEENGNSLMLMGTETLPLLNRLFQAEPKTEHPELLPRILRAMDDPKRLEILQLLRESPLYTAEIARRMEMPLPKLIYHMNLLRAGGIVTVRQEGKRNYYSLSAGQFILFCEEIRRTFIEHPSATEEKRK